MEHGILEQVVLLTDEMTLGKLVNELLCRRDISKSELLHHTLTEDKENKYLHRGVIFLSLIVQFSLKHFTFPFTIGKKLEQLLNRNIPDETSPGYISVLGHLDTRKELDKDIKPGDGRYLAALSMMASKLAYENENVIKKVVSDHWKMKFENFYNFYNEFQKAKATQAFIFRDETEKNSETVIVAFRGTSLFEPEDYSTDFDLSWCKIQKMPGKLHMGFLTALGLKKSYPNLIADVDKLKDYYHGYWPQNINDDQDKEHTLAYYTIREKLKKIFTENKNQRAKFVVTGHSLGGALAIIFPAILVLHQEWDLLERLEAVYTFGQPKVGDQEFVDFMDQKLREHKVKYYRIVYGCDVVPTVPWDNDFMRFKHFGTCIQFNSLYQGKIGDKETPPEMHEKGGYLNRGFLWLIRWTIKVANAMWEVIRGFIMEFTAGPDYREGWLLIGARICCVLLPCFIAHNPQDYVNATRLASIDLFLND